MPFQSTDFAAYIEDMIEIVTAQGYTLHCFSKPLVISATFCGEIHICDLSFAHNIPKYS